MTTETQDNVQGDSPQETPGTTATPPPTRTPRRRASTKKAVDKKTADKPSAETKTPAPKRRTTRKSAQPAAEPAPVAPIRTRPRLQEKLRSEVGPILMKEFGYTTPMQVPVLTRIALNIGLGEALDNPRAMENASRDLGLITGQRPITTRARKSIAGFKIREGMAIGLSVTLRGRRMYEFMDRLVSSALPRIRDFQGVSREAFDGRGNYSLGIREQIIFPEVDYNSIDRIRGLQVVIVTGARTDREGFRLLELLGMPFARSRSAAEVSGN